MTGRLSLARAAAAVALLVLAGCESLELGGSASYLHSRAAGDVALAPSSGPYSLANRRDDLRGDLGVAGARPGVLVTVAGRLDRLALRVRGFRHTDHGSGVLGRRYGDIPAGSLVDSRLRLLNVEAAATYDLLELEPLRLGAGLAGNFLDLDWDVSAVGSGVTESVRQQIALPMPTVCLEAASETVSGRAALAGMSGHFGDLDGTWFDAEAALRVRLHEHLDVVGGYVWTRLDSEGTAGGRRYDADVVGGGWYLGLEVRFCVPHEWRPSLH